MKTIHFIGALSCMLLLSACPDPATLNNMSPAATTTTIKSPVEKSLEKEARMAFDNEEYKKAAALYKQASESALRPSDYYFSLAESLRLSGDAKEAIDIYSQINNSQNNLDILEGIGLSFMQLGKFDRASTYFTKVVNKDATRWRTINALGVSYALQGRTNEALEYFDTALALGDNNVSIKNNVGLSLALAGEIDRAIDIFSETIENLEVEHKKRPQIEQNLALAYGISGDMEKAESILRKHLRESAVYNNLGVYAHLADDNELAKTYLSKAVSSSPVHYKRAWENMEKIN